MTPIAAYLEHEVLPNNHNESRRLLRKVMTPIAAYLEHGVLPNSHNESKKLMKKSTRYLILDGVMYRKGFSMSLLRCVNKTESGRLLEEVHEGFYGNHAGGKVCLRRF